ncbi:MAG: dihydroorotate dehydrogenase [Planctomycetota bacterium]|jgi:dihydroorotate dehydrogenase (NAD+) catalytic subunit|nr:dihydroorotate dehydrogenase [Planctomycetota bacterium]
MSERERLRTRIGQLHLDNPILSASGTYGSGKEFADFYDIGKLGGVVTKSVTPSATRGNPPPRIAETPSGMLNAIGLQNEGLDFFLAELLPPLRASAKRVIVNAAGKCEDDYVELVSRLAAAPIDAIEVNISCPNVKKGGIAFGVYPEVSSALVGKLKRVSGDMPLWIKLTPNVGDIVSVARAVADAGGDAIVAINTLVGMAVDIETRKPILANVTGGLSGPAIHPVALRMVWQIARAVSCPVIGVGGVRSVREAVAFLLVGASAVQVGAMNFVEPGIGARLVDDLDDWLREHGETVSAIIGTLEA